MSKHIPTLSCRVNPGGFKPHRPPGWRAYRGRRSTHTVFCFSEPRLGYAVAVPKNKKREFKRGRIYKQATPLGFENEP